MNQNNNFEDGNQNTVFPASNGAFQVHMDISDDEDGVG